MAKRKNPPAKAANVKTKNTPISKGTKPMCASKKRNLRSIVQPQQADKKYEVEAILDSRKRKSKTEYLVKWKNYNKSWNTWEPSTSFSESKEKIEEFKAKKLAAKAKQKKRKVSVATMTEPIPEPPPPVPLDDVEILIPVSPAPLIEPDEPVPAAPPAPPAPPARPAPPVNANANQRPRQNWDEWLRNANNLLRPQRQIPLIVLDSSDESDYDDLESVEDLMQDLDDALRGVMRVDRSTTPEEDRALSVAASYSSVSEADQPDPNPAPASSPSPQNQPTVADMGIARLGRGAILLEGLLENGSIFADNLHQSHARSSNFSNAVSRFRPYVPPARPPTPHPPYRVCQGADVVHVVEIFRNAPHSNQAMVEYSDGTTETVPTSILHQYCPQFMLRYWEAQIRPVTQ